MMVYIPYNLTGYHSTIQSHNNLQPKSSNPLFLLFIPIKQTPIHNLKIPHNLLQHPLHLPQPRRRINPSQHPPRIPLMNSPHLLLPPHRIIHRNNNISPLPRQPKHHQKNNHILPAPLPRTTGSRAVMPLHNALVSREAPRGDMDVGMLGRGEGPRGEDAGVIVVVFVNFVVCCQGVKVEFCGGRVGSVDAFEDVEYERAFVEV